MEIILNHIAQHFLEYLVVFLLVVLFFKESVTSFINAKLLKRKDPEKVPEWGQLASDRISQLAQYANHDTTERLDMLLKLEEKEHQDQKEFRDIMKDMARDIQEIKTYGIKCRDK